MKKTMFWSMITVIGLGIIYGIELFVLLNLHPAKWYFTLKGLGLVSLVETGIVTAAWPYLWWYWKNYLEKFLDGEFKTDKERA